MSASATTKASAPRKRNAITQLKSETALAEPATSLPEPEAAPPESETIMPDRDDRIREIAYFLWLEEGCSDGQAERHWRAAEMLLESDPLERKRLEGEPPGEPA